MSLWRLVVRQLATIGAPNARGRSRSQQASDEGRSEGGGAAGPPLGFRTVAKPRDGGSAAGRGCGFAARQVGFAPSRLRRSEGTFGGWCPWCRSSSLRLSGGGPRPTRRARFGRAERRGGRRLRAATAQFDSRVSAGGHLGATGLRLGLLINFNVPGALAERDSRRTVGTEGSRWRKSSSRTQSLRPPLATRVRNRRRRGPQAALRPHRARRCDSTKGGALPSSRGEGRDSDSAR